MTEQRDRAERARLRRAKVRPLRLKRALASWTVADAKCYGPMPNFEGKEEMAFRLLLDRRGVRHEVAFRVEYRQASLLPSLKEALIRSGMPKAVVPAFLERESGVLRFANVPLTPGLR